MWSFLRFCVECVPFLSSSQIVLVSVAQLIAHWTCKLGRHRREIEGSGVRISVRVQHIFQFSLEGHYLIQTETVI